ncbi:MAG: alpha/beta hydrolase, partial [Deferribacteraceae bacterium]|nr:alpha/beta hydrolase [Deferribacteraceae bacterium]
NEKIEKTHLLGVSLGAVLVQDFANHHPEMVKSLACFGGYYINNFDTKLQKGNSMAQMSMMLKAIFSIKWFAGANKKISAYTAGAQDEFYAMNIEFPKKSFMHLASLNNMVNKHKPKTRHYPLLIGCGKHDVPMELTALKMWSDSEPNCEVVIFKGAGHCVNMDVSHEFNIAIEKFWSTMT